MSAQAPAVGGNGRDQAASGRAAAASLDAAEFAEYLRTERERRHLTLDEVADATKIAPHHLAALERGDVRHWPGGMYRRAMMRAYAESIGVDREAALKQFERAFDTPPARQKPEPPTAVQEPQPAPPRRTTPVAHRRPSPRALLVGVAATLGVVIGIGLWRLASEDGVTHGAGTSTPIAAATAATNAAPPVAAPTSGSSVSTPSASNAKTTAGNPPPATAPRPATAINARAAAASASVPARSAASEGSLVVTSEPSGARVTVNGIGWGETPVTIRHLPLGDKRVRMTLQGYVSQERVVRLGPYVPDARLRLTLQQRAGTSPSR